MTAAHAEFPNAQELLGALDPDQQEVALNVTGPLCVRAGAGTGKTRAITHRIAYGAAIGAIDPGSALAVTFTAKAAAEMGTRLRQLGVRGATARTFHSAALAQLRYFWPTVFGGDLPTLTKQKASLVAAAGSRAGIRLDKTLIRDVAAEIEWTKVSLSDAAGYAARVAKEGRTPPGGLEPQQVATLIELYEAAKAERHAMDFEDVLLLTAAMLGSEEDVAASVRARYRTFVVDEYQDVSPVQHHLLQSWLGPRKELCVVGDVAQTIYSFTGASSKYLERFPVDYPDATVVELHRDYRSTPQVVAVANQVVGSARGMDGRGSGIPGAVRLTAQRPSGPAVSFKVYGSDEEEAAQVAARVRELAASGVPLGQIAILYRTNSQSAAFEEALGAEGVNFQVRGGARFFERDEIKRAVVLLHGQLRQEQMTAESLAPPGDLADQVREVVRTLGWLPEAPKAEGAARERWGNLDALVGMAVDSPDMTLGAFLQDLKERAKDKVAPEVDGVVLSTLHAAKGLEWEAVFLVGASEGLLPISLASTPEAVEEERRLLYVGITRAKRYLQISWARSRSAGRSQTRKMTRFLQGIWPQEPAAGRHSASDRRRAGDARRASEESQFERETDAQTQQLYQALKAWRLESAKELKRAPYQVLANATLRDIATAKPKTRQQLGVLRGIGDVKLSQFGADILRVVRESA